MGELAYVLFEHVTDTCFINVLINKSFLLLKQLFFLFSLPSYVSFKNYVSGIRFQSFIVNFICLSHHNPEIHIFPIPYPHSYTVCLFNNQRFKIKNVYMQACIIQVPAYSHQPAIVVGKISNKS